VVNGQKAMVFIKARAFNHAVGKQWLDIAPISLTADPA
jgi:hypothetical protein